jgi:glucose/arabinose dehydrogenase
LRIILKELETATKGTFSQMIQDSPRSTWTNRLVVAISVGALYLLAIVGCGDSDGTPNPQLGTLTLPAGFNVGIFADSVPGARSLARGEQGTVFVGTRGHGNLYALVDKDGDWQADSVYLLAEGLTDPNGVAFRDGALYVAAYNRILRFDDIESRLAEPGAPVVVNDSFPSERHHGWKFIRFGPDGRLYVPVGAPCNVCERDDPRFASIMRMMPDGSDLEIFARGVRNTVGFDFHPQTGELWFTDNGRDMMGDDLPPDELNHAPTAGLHFGFPSCHGGGIPDPEFGEGVDCSSFTPPAQELGPHVAALGMRFYTDSMFPQEYRGRIFIAEHGSWNRSVPIGYRITTVILEDDSAVSYDVFAEGWLQPDGVWGRPVDIEIMPDGSLLVSDDFAGVIYRISYRQ